MKKTILLIVVLGVAAAMLLYFAIQPTTKLPTPFAPTPTPVLPPFSIRQATPTLAPTPAGSTITINGVTMDNFYNSSTLINPQGDRALADIDGQYKIVYLDNFQQFLITVVGSPFSQYRTDAEQKLLEILNISKPGACQLQVVIRTPSYANPDQAGQDFPLSFCQ